jgi:hypothetical protein
MPHFSLHELYKETIESGVHMKYSGYYFYAEIDDSIDYNIFEPLMILLDEDFKESGLSIKAFITPNKNESLKYDYIIKLVVRLMGIQMYLPWLYKRLKQLVQTVNCKYLITYKESKSIYHPKDGNIIHVNHGDYYDN